MEDYIIFKKQVANNLSYYRKKAGLTQGDVALKINYSDKAISKWERGDGIPDAYVLSNLARIYGVSINDLLSTTQESINGDSPKAMAHKELKKKRLYIAVISSILALFVSLVTYVVLSMVFQDYKEFIYVIIWGIPVASIVGLVFNIKWGKVLNNTILETILMWSTALCTIYTVKQYTDYKFIWLILILPAAFEIIVILWNNYRALGKTNGAKRNKDTSN